MKKLNAILLMLLSSSVMAADPGTIKWRSDVQDPVRSAPVVGVDGTVYVNSDSNHLWAINPDGTKKWAFATLVPSLASPAVSEDGATIYFTNNFNNLGTLYAINANGELRWRFALEPRGYANIAGTPKVDQSGAIFVDNFYLNPSQGRMQAIYKFDPAGDLIMWSAATGSTCGDTERDRWPLWESAPDGLGGAVTVPFQASNTCDNFSTQLVNFKRANWLFQFDWSSTSSSIALSFPAVDTRRDRVYVGGSDGTLYAYSTRAQGLNVHPVWVANNVDIDFSKGAPIVDNNGKIYIGASNGGVYAFNPDGTRHWVVRPTENSINKRPAVDNVTGMVYATDQAGAIYALDGNNGRVVWSHPSLVTAASTSPVVGSDGTVYIGTSSGVITAYHGRN